MTPQSDVKPLRVAMMLESDGPGGAEYVLLQLSEELRSRGHSVFPVGPEQGNGWLGERLRSVGFDTHTFRLDRTLDLGCARRLADMFRRLKIDVVHSHEFTMAVYGALAARWSHRRHVITFHGSSTMTLALRRRIAVRWAMRRSAATVAVSANTQRQLIQDLGVEAAAIDIIRNGVPVRDGVRDPIRRELGVKDSELLVLAVGNLEKRKGHMVLLEALWRVQTLYPAIGWHLAIAGGRGGPEHDAIREFVREHSLEGRVHVLLNREDVPDLQAAADLFVMPSFWEGLPLAVLEAMLAGTPIIASAISGIPEAIESGRDGLLVPPGDPQQLADALARLFLDPQERNRLGAAAKKRGQHEFTVGAMAQAYERLYRPQGSMPTLEDQ